MKNKEIIVVYDLDGTLVDSARVVLDVLNLLRCEMNLNPISIEMILSSISLGGRDLIHNALGVTGNDVDIYLKKFRCIYLDLPTPNDSVYPNTYESLSELYHRKIKLAVCTNKPRNLADKVLNETGLIDFFSYVNAGGDLPTKKPSKENLQACIDFFDADFEQIYLVGDSTVDQHLAINAGAQFIFYAPGYDDGVDLKSAKAVIHNHSELIKFI